LSSYGKSEGRLVFRDNRSSRLDEYQPGSRSVRLAGNCMRTTVRIDLR
jgi:hypothetical protein